MADVAGIHADYEAALGEFELVTLRRYAGTTLPRTPLDANARARVAGFQPEELVGGIIQGDQKMIVLASDLITASWPVPPIKGDYVVVGDQELTIQAVDGNTRRVGGVIIAYDIVARG